jgi:hypothetical protein
VPAFAARHPEKASFYRGAAQIYADTFHLFQHASNSAFNASSDPARLSVRRFSCEIKELQ